MFYLVAFVLSQDNVADVFREINLNAKKVCTGCFSLVSSISGLISTLRNFINLHFKYKF